MGGDLHTVSPSLPSTPRRVPSGHEMKSSILYLHSPTVRPKDIVRPSGYPLIQDSLSGPHEAGHAIPGAGHGLPSVHLHVLLHGRSPGRCAWGVDRSVLPVWP